MRKLTKVLVLAAAFTALFALTALAKTGWASDENGWYYVGTDGDKLTEVVRTSNGKAYYLGEDGYMVTSKAVEIEGDLFYFDETGARVSNTWELLPADEDDETGEASRWYFFLPSGRAFKATSDSFTRKINGKKYGFDADGKMLFGYVLDGAMINDREDAILECDHLFGDNTDGAMVTGWYQYVDGFSKREAESAWFYFDDGVKLTSCTKLIGQKKYEFDSEGVMITNWSSQTPASAAYYNEDGTVKKNAWVYTTAPDAIDDNNPSSYWYYLNGAGQIDTTKAGRVALIKKKYYAFNADAQMVSGLVYLKGSDIVAEPKFDGAKKLAKTWDAVKNDDNVNLFYFSENANEAGGKDGWAINSDVTLDFDDTTVTLSFDKYTYKVLHGVQGKGYLYDHGQLQKASSKYGIKSVKIDDAKMDFFVDGSGKVVTKAGIYGDSDDNYYVLREGELLPYYYVKAGDYAYETDKGAIKYATSKEVAKRLNNNTWTSSYHPASEFKRVK